VAILALEEPEAHLHPQATRALATNLSEIKSQKIISSHSPYFIQEIPLTQIRMFRRDGPSSKVLWVKRSFTAQVPNTPDLLTFCASNAKFNYHENKHTLTVNGKVEQSEYRDLLTLYPGQQEVHAALKRLCTESQLYLDDGDLADLETYVKRIRGEALFARAWLLCEGPSDYLLFRYFAELLGTPLDQAGVSVIDFQNNGSPGAFVGLARVFEIPWVMVCDNDDAGKDFVKQVKKRGLTDQEIKKLVRPLPGDGVDLESFLLKNGFAGEYESILEETAHSSNSYATEWIIAEESRNQGAETRKIILKESGEYEARVSKKGYPDETISNTDAVFQSLFADVIVAELRKDKVRNALALVEKLRAEGADPSRVPQFLGLAVKDIIAKVV
jgi:putative ATP-dependent endonuclease of OLD family